MSSLKLEKDIKKLEKVLSHPSNTPLHFRGISKYIFLMLQKWNYFYPEMEEMINIYYEKIKEPPK